MAVATYKLPDGSLIYGYLDNGDFHSFDGTVVVRHQPPPARLGDSIQTPTNELRTAARTPLITIPEEELEEELELEDCAHESGARTSEAARSSGSVSDAVLRIKGTIVFDASRGV